MTTILVIAAFVLFFGVILYLSRNEKIEDKNENGIPDVIEDKVEVVKTKINKKVTAVKTRVKKVKSDVNDVVEDVKDVVSTIKGKPTKSKLNSLTKEQLVSFAKKDHGIDLDISVQKSTLVNKVYSLYNKPQK
jgi:hypothetical protein